MRAEAVDCLLDALGPGGDGAVTHPGEEGKVVAIRPPAPMGMGASIAQDVFCVQELPNTWSAHVVYTTP